MKESDLHEYQVRTVNHMLAHDRSMLFLDPGLGKTIATLTAIDRLMYDSFEVKGVLVMAPKRVVQSVWRQEAAKWDHTKHLTFSVITGTVDDRIRALCAPADIYLVNYENMVWLQTEVEHRFLTRGKYPPWNMAVFDELTRMKKTRIRQGAKRGIAALKLMMYCPYRTGLTGSPAPNGLEDLFGQTFVIDSGERLGKSFTAYQQMYFYLKHKDARRWYPFAASADQISAKIADITINLDAEDYLDLPDVIPNDIHLKLPPMLQTQYDSIEREMLVELQSGHEIEIFNKASLLNRCLQYAGGGVYLAPGSPDWEQIHTIKLDAMEEIVNGLAGQPLLVLYQYQHEAQRMMKRFPDALWISSKTSEEDFNQALLDWNAGLLPIIIGHPASMGHGVDRLQHNCHNLLWFGLPWAFDLYDQSNKRIDRQGQEHPVMRHRLIMDGTVDELVVLALEEKESTEAQVRDLIEAYGKTKLGETK
jgi:hypothetical protein